MKTKFKTIIIAFATVLMMPSCDWLDVTSSSQLQADKLFETRAGFQEALTGVYMNMGKGTAYGGNYMWSVNNYVAYPYKIVDVPTTRNIQKHFYTSLGVKNILTQMWSEAYTTIANINKIILELDKRRNVISSETEYKLMKGELYALRAYVHFDLMRMFGLNNWEGENANKLTVPYSLLYSKDVVPQLTYAETEALLIEDLEIAIECLKVSDPILGVTDEFFDASINADGYWTNRQKHMNYYATLALAARIYQWKHDYVKATEYAQEVVDGAIANNLVKWVDYEALVKESMDDYVDWNFSTEHLFSLEVTDLYNQLSTLLFSGQRVGLYIDDSFVNQIFPLADPVTGSLAGAEDIRGTALQLKYTSYGYISYKYYGSSTYNYNFRNRIPMLRLSEMHYIIAEGLITDGKKADALAELDKVRVNRGITDALVQEVDPAQELLKEYYREFIGEDKLFYYLKHIEVESSLSSTFDLKASELIYPYPDSEINFGRKQDL